MRIIFLGTPAFAIPTLEAIVEAGHEVPLAVTQPDRPRGRGHELSSSPVKQAAIRLRLPVYQPERIRIPEAQARLAQLKPEIMVVVGYGQIIPQAVIDIPARGIVNVHASLLPKYRGAAPIQWAIINGETRTGVTTMQINAGLDTGDILRRAETEIGSDETAIELGERLSVMGADLLVETLRGLERSAIVPQKQEEALATYAPVLNKDHGRIDWTLPAPSIYNRARGLLPWPGAHTRFRGQMLHVWRVRIAHEHTPLPPGRFLSGARLSVACGGGGVLELLDVQLEGRKRISGPEFARGQRLNESDILGEDTLREPVD